MFLSLLVLLLATVNHAFLPTTNIPHRKLTAGEIGIKHSIKPGRFASSFRHYSKEKRQYRTTHPLYLSELSPSSSSSSPSTSTNFTQLIRNCVYQLSYENLRISLVESDSVPIIEWLANFSNENSKLSYEVFLEKLSVMEDQQLEIKGAYKSPDIKVMQTFSPSSIAKSLEKSTLYVCSCLEEDLLGISKENDEALALATVWAKRGSSEYKKAKTKALENRTPRKTTTNERLRREPKGVKQIQRKDAKPDTSVIQDIRDKCITACV